ncbi:hypothetical protein ECTT12B_4574, partial [Escherichia coli TT12B]
MARQV